jgi:hypothetical protein
MRFFALLSALLFALTALTGCGPCPRDRKAASLPAPRAMKVVCTEEPITLDGRLDEPLWRRARAYPLRVPRQRGKYWGEKPIQETGTVRLAFDGTNLYVAAELTDADVVAEGEADQLRHYALGDVIEVFLKPAGLPWYWEIYGTPRGYKSEIFYPGGGRKRLPSSMNYHGNVAVAATIRGTLNDWQDRDEGWTVEIAVPVKDLKVLGEGFDPERPWTILVGRYNYSRYLHHWEVSSTSRLAEPGLHFFDRYRPMVFEKACEDE